jgi:hypothetical protein
MTCQALTLSANNLPVPYALNGRCNNMVDSVDIVFYYGVSYTNISIDAFEINVILKNNVINVGTTIRQKFSSQYVKAPDPLSVVEPAIRKSGNPGYFLGAPLLGGLPSTKYPDAIAYTPEPLLGLSIIKEAISKITPFLQCTNSNADYGNRIPVTFGEDIVSGCTMYLTMPDLSAGCQALRLKIYELQTLTAKNIKNIGIFGNASVNNKYDWIDVISDPPSGLFTGDLVIFTFSVG